MPELPEVETTLRGIAPHIEGKTVETVILRQPKLRWQVNPALGDILSGQQVLSCGRRAKYLIVRFPMGILLIHLGMSGSLRIFTPSDERIGKPGKHDHTDFVFSDGTVLRYHDPRRFGAILWYEGIEEYHPLLEKLGPELFRAAVSPKRPACRVKKKDCAVLVDAVKAVLRRAIETGGSTLKDFVDSNGKSGYFQQEYTVYGRHNLQCVRCGGLIVKEILGQRGTFYCPNCQK